MGDVSRTLVLVVDDHPEILGALAEVLRAEDYDVVLARGGREALDLLLSGNIDVALVDLRLPELSGTDLLERARAAGLETQLILMTAQADVQSATLAVRHRAFAYLEKPFDLDLVLGTVANAARMLRLDRENRRMVADLKARAAELDAVAEVARAASESLDRDEMLKKALAAARRVLDADVEVLLADEAQKRLELVARDAALPALAETVAFGEGPVGRVARTGRMELADPLGPAQAGRYAAYAAAPLVAKGRLVGVLGAGRTQPFEPGAEALFPRLAGVVAVALENALLFERAQEALQQLRQSQARVLENERLAVVGQLTGGLAHEINTPTAFILADLHVLGTHLAALERFARGQSPAPGEEIDRALSEAGNIVAECREGAERIRRIVRDLRTFGRSAREGLQPVNLSELVDSALGMLRPQLEAKAHVERDIHEVPPVDGHPGRLLEVLVHLLQNALDALPDGRSEGARVVVSTRADGGEVVVRIRDTGSGIPASVLPRVFDPYFTTKPVGQGTGLGLALSLDVVRHHGGDLSLESVEGQGTVAEVRLPAANRARRAGDQSAA